MSDLLIDSNIRLWVFIPIVLITFLIGIIRHYLSIMFQSTKRPEVQQIHDSQLLLSARDLRMNGHIVPKNSFLARKHVFNNESSGLLTAKKNQPSQNLMSDPIAMVEMLKGNILNMFPMIVIGGWINWMLSGFIITKIPFPLTLRFKGMLQRGIELTELDASWVSSASWYFLNVFGLRSVFTLVLGENNAADQSKMMQDQMTGNLGPMSQDMKGIFKAEWEALEISDPQWIGETIDADFFDGDSDADC